MLRGKSVIYVANEREEKNGDDKQIRPEIGGSSAGDLIKELDLVGYMEAIGKEKTISFEPCVKFYGKNTCNLASRIKIPIIINEEGVVTGQNEFMTNIIATYKNYQARQSDLSGQYECLMTDIKDAIEQVTDAPSANEVKDLIMNFDHIFDSKIKAGMMLNAKCSSLGLKYNKLTKIYEAA